MVRLKVWLRAIRAPFFTATIVPVILGASVAWHKTGVFNWGLFLLTLIGILFIHTGTNLANDYYDHTSRDDELNPTPTPFSGGSRMIQDKLISPKAILYVALASFALGCIIGLYLNYILVGNLLLALGIIGVFLGFFYTADPLRIGYHSFGELAVGFGFGPLVVLGSYYVQAESLSWVAFFVSIPVGIMIMLVLYINEFPDYEADRKVNKKTLVVTLGKGRAIKLYFSLLILCYLFIVAAVIIGLFPLFSLIVLLTLPLSFKAVRVARENYERVYELLPANAATIGLHLSIGLLLSLGFILDKIF